LNFVNRFSKNETLIFSTDFQKIKLEFSQQIFKKYSSNLIKIRPMAAKLFHADGRTENITKLTVAFRNFGNAPQNVQAVLLTEESMWPA
jgi:hypothetical protein